MLVLSISDLILAVVPSVTLGWHRKPFFNQPYIFVNHQKNSQAEITAILSRLNTIKPYIQPPDQTCELSRVVRETQAIDDAIGRGRVATTIIPDAAT